MRMETKIYKQKINYPKKYPNKTKWEQKVYKNITEFIFCWATTPGQAQKEISKPKSS